MNYQVNGNNNQTGYDKSMFGNTGLGNAGMEATGGNSSIFSGNQI